MRRSRCRPACLILVPLQCEWRFGEPTCDPIFATPRGWKSSRPSNNRGCALLADDSLRWPRRLPTEEDNKNTWYRRNTIPGAEGWRLRLACDEKTLEQGTENLLPRKLRTTNAYLSSKRRVTLCVCDQMCAFGTRQRRAGETRESPRSGRRIRTKGRREGSRKLRVQADAMKRPHYTINR
ncbi:hypothetical protein BDQ94DRAFT_90736 [Aspergillus welwitschiae]|uniref:Uncharacterized protein n=1 Tax=Aspergillus welwitschiae TaxID=1341132 RepID=A0A3F3QE11_9EURO|nr:hypothetical protein BDQ94DRAFT_90736 [Aspergillus welwitschiae]RDH37534.1 hypothetical protein BDQ94DRAFT_90736 [Aspergillus welwitschiae]